MGNDEQFMTPADALVRLDEIKKSYGLAPLDNCTMRVEACGCTVQGDGTLPEPARVKYCPKHAAAPEMYESLRAALAKADGKVAP